METLAKVIRGKVLKKDILAKVLLNLLEKQNEAKREKYHKNFERVYRLTPRQIQITKLLLDGYSYPEIANSLHIAVNTVRCHARRIYLILGVKRRREIKSRISDDEADLIRKWYKGIPK
jgi:DNA-binding NarL/FixJ family response regulator